ncbi:hypothetical protein DLR11_05900 [Salmonella enterica subsp. salamae]|uniref:Uncharacterized protein n=1 Tax=Salmonella enterica subsp. salamae TaxID=59202 RepID=A0A5Y3UZ10_SALER|nr:hypothetical protein [Salmonella enterica subsp. salamae]ECI3451392.1 hypothetical protein [Salmonella enterica subsp. salamae]ECJ2325835.1 hypothetical protein [Salmonella enterica subsp. salamae]
MKGIDILMVVILSLCGLVESSLWQQITSSCVKKEVMEARVFINQALHTLNDVAKIMMNMASYLKLRISLSVTLGHFQIG